MRLSNGMIDPFPIISPNIVNNSVSPEELVGNRIGGIYSKASVEERLKRI